MQPKIAEMSTRIREIQWDINNIGEQQRRIAAERQPYEDHIRSE